ncbi:hypothetical protein [uncultured Actinobacillus sp.]|nr:hypothetical protein [uncultured Actinobacillus sp.]
MLLYNVAAFLFNTLSNRATALENPHQRHDGYGNLVNDRAILELTAKKPRAELFSVIPKGDSIKPND